jgi:hypothetical protein
MNCQNHPETPATAYCRACGKAVCDECRRDAFGTVYCADHAPAPAAAEPPPAANPGAAGIPNDYAAAPAGGAPPYAGVSHVYANHSPGLAFFLGLIPGVGAIYNGQYAKGIVHAVIWGVLMSIANSAAARGMEPICGVLVAAWWAYMAFEAHHTAHKLRAGEPVDECSSILNLTGGRNHIPLAGILLIALGALLLLHTLDLLDFDEYAARYWPVLLIAAGVYLLAGRFLHGTPEKEPRHER